MRSIKSMMMGGAILFGLAMCFTSCEGTLDDIFGEWSRPTPGSSTGGGSVAVTSISIDATLTLIAGKTSQLTATVDPAGTAVTWSSDPETIATVDANGLVTAVAAGTAIITAKAGDKSATCKVTVLPKGSLAGVFSVSATKQVRFSQGNLQATYDGTKWTWAFAENQWDCIGNAEGNTKVTASAPFVAGYTGSSTTIDLFGWVGASSTWTDVNQYGIILSSNTGVKDGYGDSTSDVLNDWGTNMGAGWRTLTNAEWTYLFNTREVNGETGSDKSYTLGQSVNGKLGIVIYPDDYKGTVYAGSDWSTFEAAGCVFLPAAGYRPFSSYNVQYVNTYGLYWSSSPSTSSATTALYEFFTTSSLNSSNSVRNNLSSVRLVRDAE